LRIDTDIAVPALLVALGYYLAARLGLALTLQPHPISTLWPPNALLMAALLLVPARSRWVLLAAALSKPAVHGRR
jgi:integral membrane sensor domain MASE1